MTLARMLKYRRTISVCNRWKPPRGVTLQLVLWPADGRVDAIVSCPGFEEASMNIDYWTDAMAERFLGHMARQVMRRAVEAYRTHELPSDARLEFALDVADRAFLEGIESALCRGKGRDE